MKNMKYFNTCGYKYNKDYIYIYKYFHHVYIVKINVQKQLDTK